MSDPSHEGDPISDDVTGSSPEARSVADVERTPAAPAAHRARPSRAPDTTPPSIVERVRRAMNRARLAPSPHNTQSARWQHSGVTLTLLEAPTARLPVCDPTLRDTRTALGCAWESAAIALAAEGLRWEAQLVSTNTRDANGLVPVLRGALVDDDTPPNARHQRSLDTRVTYRGPMAPLTVEQVDRLQARVEGERVLVRGDAATRKLVESLVVDATKAWLKIPGFYEELWGWLRMGRDHPRWAKDGVNGDAFGLPRFVAWVSQGLLSPPAVKAVPAVGVAVFSEKPVLKTVPAWFFLKDDSADDDVMGQLEYGRRFLRAWLEVTAMGLVCCPMTPIVHDPKTNQALAAHAGIRAPERLACVWRVGALPKGGVLPTHARLSLDDILL